MLGGALIGMVIAMLLVILIPGLRKTIVDSHKQGSKAGERFGNKLMGREGEADPSVPAAPTRRHKACPNCGCKKFKFADTTTPWADTGFFSAFPAKDRCCKKCGTVYAMLLPPAVRWIFIIMGLPIALGGVAIYFYEGEILAPIMCVFAGGFLFALGLMLPSK